MTALFLLTLAGLGAVGAFCAGLLGVGGAIVMIPLLLYVPPALGVGALDVRTVAAVTMVQVFVAALAGVLAHRRYRAVNAELAWTGGLAMAAASFAGAAASRVAPERALLVVFALMVTAAAPLLLLPPALLAPPPSPVGPGRVSRTRTVAVTATVGFAAGLVGAGGAFLLVPLLIGVVGVPVREAIGSSLAITALAATSGVAGKLLTGQVPLAPALAVALGAIPGAQLGAAVSRRLGPASLKLALLAVVVASGVRVWADVLTR